MTNQAAWAPLQPGDRILIIAPSGALQKDAYPQIVDMFTQWGLDPVMPRDLVREGGYFQWPNTPERRASHIIDGLNDPSIKAIFALEGGEGALEVTELIKRRKDRIQPRADAIPLIGYSDVGQLHTYLGQSGQVSPVYGPTIEYLADFGDNDTAGKAIIAGNRTALRDFLMGERARPPEQNLISINASAKAGGTVDGITIMPNPMAEQSSHRVELIPGEHYILMAEARSAENLRYQLQAWQARPGMSQIEGIVIGRYTDNQTWTGPLEEADVSSIRNVVNELGINIPVYYGAAFGHAKWGLNAAPIQPTPLHVHAGIQSDGEHATLSMDRFRAQDEASTYRQQPVSLRLADRTAPPVSENCFLRADIDIKRHLPDTSTVLDNDTKGKNILLTFPQPDINTVHIALSELLAAGKLDGIGSLLIMSTRAVPEDTKQWLADFQKLHLPDIAVSTLDLPAVNIGSHVCSSIPRAPTARHR